MRHDRITVAFLALFLTPFGVPFFYLGRTKVGLFCIALTVFAHGPFKLFLAIVGVGLFFYFLGTSDEEFQARYRTKRMGRKNKYQVPVTNFGRTDSSLYENLDARRRLQPSEEPLVNLNTLYQNAIKKATDKYNAFDYDGAITDFNEALQYKPRDINANWFLTCCYSVLEEKLKAFQSLEKTVACGFVDFKRIITANELAYMRLQPEFYTFTANKYKLTPEMITEMQKVLV